MSCRRLQISSGPLGFPGLSDEHTEYQLRDRLSFMRFVGLGLHEPVPDAKTIWLFREQLTRAGALSGCFDGSILPCGSGGMLAMGGQIVDATVVQARPVKLTAEEKAAVHGGETPADWSPVRRAQIDGDARWTLKRDRKRPPPADGTSQRQAGEIAVPMFGYKNHVGIDRTHGLTRTWTVTHVAAHDGGQLEGLLDAANTASGSGPTPPAVRSPIWPCSPSGGWPPACSGPSQRAGRCRRTSGAATPPAVRSAPRSSLARARTKLGLANLAYNLLRFTWLDGRIAPA